MTGAPCWDWWETLRWDGQIGARGMRVGAMMNGCGLIDGLGWGGDWEWGVWCWDSVRRAADVPTQRCSTYPTYPHPIPYNTKSFPRIPIAYAPLATLHSHHLAQTPTHNIYPTFIPPNSTPAPTLLQPTLSDHIHSPPYTIPPPDTPYPLPTRPTPTSHPNQSAPL